MLRSQRTRAIAATLIGAAVALGACASGSGMQNLWTDPTYKMQPVQDVLVIVVRKDAPLRQYWEDAFVSELKRHGVRATPSHTLFDEVPDTAQVTQAVQEHHFASVMISERVSAEREAFVVPGRTNTVSTRYFPPGPSHFDRAETVQTIVVEPSTTETKTILHVRTDVWAGEGADRLVWSGTIGVDKPLDGRRITECVAKRIVPGIATAGLLP